MSLRLLLALAAATAVAILYMEAVDAIQRLMVDVAASPRDWNGLTGLETGSRVSLDARVAGRLPGMLLLLHPPGPRGPGLMGDRAHALLMRVDQSSYALLDPGSCIHIEAVVTGFDQKTGLAIVEAQRYTVHPCPNSR